MFEGGIKGFLLRVNNPVELVSLCELDLTNLFIDFFQDVSDNISYYRVSKGKMRVHMIIILL